MRTVRVGELEIGSGPVLVATACSESVEGMVRGVERALAAGADCVELRIDSLPTAEDVERLVRGATAPHIVACRTPQFGGSFTGSEAERIERLAAAARAGATAIDIEFFAEPASRDRLIAMAKRTGTPVLIGYENMGETPPLGTLLQGLQDIAALAPDLVKLAVKAASYADLVTVLQAALDARSFLDVPFAAIALGPHGAPSRPLACAFGASFTYCAVEAGNVPGQLTVSETREILGMVSEQRWSCSSS